MSIMLLEKDWQLLLKEIGILLKYLHGQGYNSTAAMSGHFNSVQGYVIKVAFLLIIFISVLII